MKYIDIHNHILPGLDDGAQDLEEALGMVDIAYKEGARDLVLTPHYEKGKNQYKKDELRSRFEEFAGEVSEKYKDMNLYLGNEILWGDGVMDDLRQGLIQTMNDTKYVLVEFNIRVSYKHIYDAMRQLINARFRPIIAHVERYQSLFKHPERLDELLGMDVYLQMNFSSVYGGMLDENARWCKKLVREGYISFFGTDAHDLDNRAPYVKDYVGWIEKKCGTDALTDMFYNNPKKMLNNEYLS